MYVYDWLWTFFFWSTGSIFLPKKVPWLPATSLNLTTVGVVPTLKRLYSWWRWRLIARYNSPNKTGRRGHIPSLSMEWTICIKQTQNPHKCIEYRWYDTVTKVTTINVMMIRCRGNCIQWREKHLSWPFWPLLHGSLCRWTCKEHLRKCFWWDPLSQTTCLPEDIINECV